MKAKTNAIKSWCFLLFISVSVTMYVYSILPFFGLFLPYILY